MAINFAKEEPMSKYDIPYINDAAKASYLKSSMYGQLEYTLMNDFLIKYSLQKDSYALSGLLAALLNIDINSITDITMLNPIEPGSNISDKDCIFDIKLELNHEKIINIEIQARRQEFWPERSITYLCRIFDQLEEGDSYREIKPCIHIGIMDHDVFTKDDPRYTGQLFSEYHLLETSAHTEYTSKFSIMMLSLSHLEDIPDNERSSDNSLYYWAKLFKATTWEELKMIADNNSRIDSLCVTIKELTAEEKIRQACEARRRYSNDIATYEGDIAELKKEKEAIQAEVDSYKAEANSYKAEADSYKAEADSYKAEADSYKAEADSYKAEADSYKKKVKELESQLAALK